MTQIFIFGSSSAYGVGGEHGGWADMLKNYLHQMMYKINGFGEVCEIYNFAKPGATVDFVQQNFLQQLKTYMDEKHTLAIVAIGSNNAKARGMPDHFISSPEDFSAEMLQLLTDIKSQVTQVLVIGYTYCDETKTTPKPSLSNQNWSYFWNARTQHFNDIVKKHCVELGLTHVNVTVSPDDWIATCLYKDGLHPNDAGYQAIFASLTPHIDAFIQPA